MVAGVAVPAALSLFGDVARANLALLVLAALACAGGNLFEVFAPGHYALQPNLAIFFSAAILLPPWASALVAVAAFLPSWLAGRSAWFKAAFNMGNYALAAAVATAVLHAHDPFTGPVAGAQTVAILVGAAAAFAVVNHLLIV